MFRSLCVLIKCVTEIYGDNLGMIISCTNPESELKKKHVEISYHKLWECVAARIVNPIKVCTAVNRSNIFTKGVLVGTLGSFSDASYGVDWGESYTNSPWFASRWLVPRLYYRVTVRASLWGGQ